MVHPFRTTITILTVACWCGAPSADAADVVVPFTGNRLLVSSVDGDLLAEYEAGVNVRTFGDPTLEAPRGIAFGPDGNLYVASGSAIFRFGGDGELVTTLGSGTGLSHARGLTFGPNGNLFVTSQDRVLELSPAGALVRTIGADSALGVPVALCFGADGHLFVAAAGSNAVVEFDATGARVRTLDLPSLAIPMGIAYSGSGNLYVSSFFGNSVAVVDSSGTQVATFTDPNLLFPASIAIGPDGNIYVASFFSAMIVVFDVDGVKRTTIPLPTGAANPEGIAFAPFRFAIRLEGRLTRQDGPPASVLETGFLSLTPGSPRVHLGLDEGDLRSTFGSSTFVFHGFESKKSEIALTRYLQGTEISTLGDGCGQASLSLTVKGKVQSFATGDVYSPKKVSGTLHRGGPQGVFDGTLTTTGSIE